MRYLGIDYGTKRVGLALSDESGSLAFAHSVLSPKEAASSIKALVEAEGVEVVVLGESLDLQGAENPLMKKIKSFKVELESVGLKVVFEPEGMTSAQAARSWGGESAQSASRRGSVGRQKNLDASAAALILQGYLDKIKN